MAKIINAWLPFRLDIVDLIEIIGLCVINVDDILIWVLSTYDMISFTVESYNVRWYFDMFLVTLDI
jgi:N6-adenosine-specific RNA methylase IME4